MNIMNNINIYSNVSENGKICLMVTVAAVFEVISQMLIKRYSISKKLSDLVIAMIMYCIICWYLYQLYSYKAVGVVQALWSGLSIILSLVIGMYMFNEQVTHKDWMGVVLIIAGILLLFEHA